MSGEAVRVLFANNYDMARARAGWLAGTYPGHHLFGTAQLGPPFAVTDLPYSSENMLAAISRRTRGVVGDVGQQLAAAKATRAGSSRWGGIAGSAGAGTRAIVYGAAAHELRGLAALRAAGLFGTPIVGVFHGAGARGGLARHGLRGFDRAIAMSRHTRDGLLEQGMAAERIVVLGWGADLEFPGFAPATSPPPNDAKVVATGKTGRDMPTLLAALRETGLAARVYGDVRELRRSGPIPRAVDVVPASAPDHATSVPLTYEHTLADLRSAALVAIPLAERRPLHGLTEVVDALACGRPMIVTRAPYFDFDIEEIGCGWWVEPGDTRGWVRLLSAAMSDGERLDEMGRAGRAWASEHLNAQLFEDGVRGVLLELLSAGG